jgi:hypothetical protein
MVGGKTSDALFDALDVAFRPIRLRTVRNEVEAAV